MGCATINETGSRIFCPAAKAMSEALRRIIDCSSKRFSTDTELVSVGAICLGALAIGRSSISASIDGRRAEFSSVFSSCWRVITTTNTGQTHDLACAEPLLEKVDPEVLIGDEAYADPIFPRGLSRAAAQSRVGRLRKAVRWADLRSWSPMSRYAHGVAVADSRLIAVNRAGVTFKRKNYRIRAATDTSG